MNRQIKFRAWDEVTKEMHYQRLDTKHEAARILKTYELIMQDTGKRGKDNYPFWESDIVGLEDGTPIGVIVWCKFNSGFIVQNEKSTHNMPYASNNYIVLGNIYQNPEILNKIT